MDDDDAKQNDSFNDDYYGFLNVPRDASSESIRNSYKVLSRRFHPDKHNDPALKRQASIMFDRLKKVYDVLSDENKRAIYDTLGPSGLEPDGWALVEKKFKSSKEIKEEYEQMMKEKEERLLQQRTNPKGSVTVLVDATELFEPSDEDESGRLSAIEVGSMTITQSIEAPLTLNDNVTLNGNINVRNGVGSGTISSSFRHVFSPTTWGELEFGAGHGPMVGLKGFHTMTKDIHITCQTLFHITPFGIRPGLNTVLTRQFSKNFIGYLTYKTGVDSSMSTVAVYENEWCRVNSSIQFGIRNSFVSTSYTHKFKLNETRVKLGVRLTLLGSMLEYGCETRVSKHSILGASMSVGNASGVALRLKLNRNNQNYIFPILLSEELLPASVFYGSIVPLLSYYLVKSFIVDPYLKQKEAEEMEQKKESSSTKISEKKNEAMAYIVLMKETYERILEREHMNQGLIVDRAIYGTVNIIDDIVSQRQQFHNTSNAFDVTVALQVMVNDDSTIRFSPTSKSHLPGFYDPDISAKKKLLIRYKHHNQLYQVVLNEMDAMVLPCESHRIT